MKNFGFKKVATLLICSAFMLSSCVGSFSLHSRLLSWNQSIGSKFVNELIYLACNIVPVYPICYTVDAVILNSVEFWTGNNPVASIGEVKKVQGEDGNYLVETLENAYSITKEGESVAMQLVFDQELNTWNVVADGVSTELLKLNDDNTASISLPNGEELNVSLDEEGIAEARQALTDTYFAAR